MRVEWACCAEEPNRWTILLNWCGSRGFAASAEGFTNQAKVINGASEFFAAVLGDAGSHARFAVGASELPLGASVEVALIAEVRAYIVRTVNRDP